MKSSRSLKKHKKTISMPVINKSSYSKELEKPQLNIVENISKFFESKMGKTKTNLPKVTNSISEDD